MSTDVTIKAAMSVARDVAEGRLDPDELGRTAADECRQLFGTVAGPADALWPLHVDVARQAIAMGALATDELIEWASVMRRREQGNETTSEGTETPAEPISAASGPHSPESGDSEPEPTDISPGLDS